MSFTVLITDTTTGETRPHNEDVYDWDDNTEYLWSDGGNYSCDCNRGLFFYWSKHPWVKGSPSPDVSCGDSRYQIAVKVGNVIVYDEGQDDE